MTNRYSYSNLKGVTRIGINYKSGVDKSFGYGIDIENILSSKNTFKWSGDYMQYDRQKENSFYIRLSMSYGKFLFNIGRRIYTRGVFGIHTGYEKKDSKVINDNKKFLFVGSHIGLEPEIFLHRNVILYIGFEQYGQYYIDNLRTSWNAYSGLRISF
jgi:hypothetical protein